ncbi:RNA methyltransferase [Alphaproteobacteria bacterium LSUCC0684]
MAGTNRKAVETDGPWADLLPGVILVEPQMGENIGAAARAMKNCGLSRLHLVSPRDGWPNPAADAMASGGIDILNSASLADNTAEAAASYTMIAATTARRRGMAKECLTPPEAAERLAVHARSGGKTALLFGPERAGLDNADVALADFIITVPLNPVFSSLNLAQAVLLMGWECRKAAASVLDMPLLTEEDGAPEPATVEEREFFFRVLEEGLDEGGFFTSSDMRPVVMRNITAMFQRSTLSMQDIRTLHGMVKALRQSTPRKG